jgi:hypothetical protein
LPRRLIKQGFALDRAFRAGSRCPRSRIDCHRFWFTRLIPKWP